MSDFMIEIQIGDLLMLTARAEDYLKEIFLLESTAQDITITDLSEQLGISKSAVTVTVQKLVQAGALVRERYGSIYFTAEGRRKGFLIYRRYEGLRAFFHELLGMDRNHSSKMACNMEHYIDAVAGDRLYALLEFFRRAKAEREPWVDELFKALETQVSLPNPLSVLEDGQKGFVTHLTADKELRERLQCEGFKTGAYVMCLNASAGDSLRVSLSGKQLTIPRSEAAVIWLRMA
jgi:DtxR family Mn-dependent transcriptional regulator